MESNLFEIKFTYHIGKVIGYEVRSKQVPHLIHVDVIKVLFAVFLLEQLPKGFLLFLLRKEKPLDHRQERQRADAGFCLEHVLAVRHELAVDLNLDHLVIDRDALFRKVDRFPLQPKHLAAAQTDVVPF